MTKPSQVYGPGYVLGKLQIRKKKIPHHWFGGSTDVGSQELDFVKIWWKL